MTVEVHALDHIVINVADVARSAEWYRKVLGMQ
ncbi:MAG TPA: VOC family protein, partial [Bradyrhizobium sp.]|nr:VOC family protein [Bradyrhizobium sp.]